MSEPFTMPKLGLTMTEGTIREWLVADGTQVRVGEAVLIIETDKVETEVEARVDGVLRVVGVVGATYECGAVIGQFFTDDSGRAEAAAPASTPPPMAVTPVEAPLEEPPLAVAPIVEAPSVEHSIAEVPSVEVPSVEAPTVVAPGRADPVDAVSDVGDERDVHDLFVDEQAGDEPVPDENWVDEHWVDERWVNDADAHEHLGDDDVALDLTDGVEDNASQEQLSFDEVDDLDVGSGPVIAAPVTADAGIDDVVPVVPADPEPVMRTESTNRRRRSDVAVLADIAERGVGGRILASPRARRTAGAASIDLAVIAGTGPSGRIVHVDVLDAVAEREQQRVADERAEAQRRRAERAEAERREAERRAAEELEAERLEAERAAAAELETVQREAERRAAEEAERVAQERAAAERAAAEQRSASVAEPAPVAAPPSMPVVVAPAADGAAVSATAGARLLADFLGVDVATIPAADAGRVTREDVGVWVRRRLATNEASSSTSSAPSTSAPTTATPPPAPLQEPAQMIPFEGMRGIIAERMHGSLADMAQLTLSVDVDMTAVNGERERRRSSGQTVPGYTAWVVAAASQAIEGHGYVNSQVTPDGLAVLPDVHVGVAVALDEGLIVPVIEHANLRTVEETHSVVADLAGRARNGKLAFHELEGATFSVTALGMYGVDMFTPVINPPNTAILGVGRLRSETAWRDGQPVETTKMTLSLTWDHRAFDGAPAAEFAQTIVRLLEAPTELV